VLVSQGQNIADAIRQIGVSEVTYYRWQQEYGGLKTEQVKRLKKLETENARLRKAISDLTLEGRMRRRTYARHCVAPPRIERNLGVDLIRLFRRMPAKLPERRAKRSQELDRLFNMLSTCGTRTSDL